MLDKTVALVTGSSRGIGKAIALKFAREGMAVVLTARHEKDLQKVAREIIDEGGTKTLIIPADLKKESDIIKLADEVIKQWGRIDVLVNNAGVGYLKPFLELKMEEFQEMLDLNIRAVFALTQQVLPHMIERKTGTIINIASLAGKNGFKSGTGYGASKWALRGFAQSLMLEVREHDIRVVTIFPGSVQSDFGSGESPTGTLSKNKMQPGDIAETAFMAFLMPVRTMVSEIDMRPTNPSKN
ncbi:MAG: SDR family NAD(P)-dependent oxidoreductase [Calditrichaeota bacterium]|nr:MAG: SDR family NAD(P)-dependent oxidoreductase [Calditrichota bacterium]